MRTRKWKMFRQIKYIKSYLGVFHSKYIPCYKMEFYNHFDKLLDRVKIFYLYSMSYSEKPAVFALKKKVKMHIEIKTAYDDDSETGTRS